MPKNLPYKLVGDHYPRDTVKLSLVITQSPEGAAATNRHWNISDVQWDIPSVGADIIKEGKRTLRVVNDPRINSYEDIRDQPEVTSAAVLYPRTDYEDGTLMAVDIRQSRVSSIDSRGKLHSDTATRYCGSLIIQNHEWQVATPAQIPTEAVQPPSTFEEKIS